MCNRLRARPIYYHPLREAIKKNIESVIIIIPNGGRGGGVGDGDQSFRFFLRVLTELVGSRKP